MLNTYINIIHFSDLSCKESPFDMHGINVLCCI